jgi:ESCRT-I complex subunit TSG101
MNKYEVEQTCRLATYRFPERVAQDIEQCQQYQYMHPVAEMGNLTGNDGKTNRLMYLTGTLAVTMNTTGATYNFPVDVWLPLDYPEVPPVCYVKPTLAMHVSFQLRLEW